MAKTGDSFYGKHHQPYVLGEEIGSGGEGMVFKTSDENLVAKIYKTPSAKMERKILSMLKLNIEMKSPGGIPLITWPKDILYEGETCVGYVMPFAGGGEPIWNMGRPEGRNKVFHGKYDWSKALAVATNISSLVSYLHSMGIVIGDMNSNNIFVHSNGYVTIMDVDSFDIWDKDTQEHFKCQVGRPEYLAPELQARRLSEESAAFTQETDDFALAVHIFQLLFYAHPFNMKMIDRKEGSRGENQQADAIVEGECPFVKPGYEHMIQAGVPYLSMLPDYLQQDFRDTFSYNALNSVQQRGMRTKAAKWYQDLGKLYRAKELVPCSVNSEHYYLREKGCELCRAKQRLDDQNKRMAQWDIQSVCVNQQQGDVSTNLDSVSSKERWYSHYKVNNSPLSMSIPLYVRRTYPNGESTEIQELPQSYKTGDWISIEGSTQKEEQKRAGIYTIELFDKKQQLLVSSSVRLTEPVVQHVADGGTTTVDKRSKVLFYKKRGPILAMVAVAIIVGACLLDKPDDPDPWPTTPAPTSAPWREPALPAPTLPTEVPTSASETSSAVQTSEETTQIQETENNFRTGGVAPGLICIVNVSGRAIAGLYISESTDTSWDMDRNCLDSDSNVLLKDQQYLELPLSFRSSWDMMVVTEDGGGWQFLKLNPDLIYEGSEIQIEYQDRSVFANIASNDPQLDGQVITSVYTDTNELATQAATQAPSEYILPDSDRKYYSESELSGLTLGELRLARNELYARHGRKFEDQELQAYFESCSWYRGTIEASDFNEEIAFNRYEKANRDLIKKLEGN